jgi:hemerythrin-like metal-binding protein
MATGAPTLDTRHRVLVERAATLVATIGRGDDRPQVEKALREFGDYAVRHFSTEMECALGGNCPALEWSGAARAELIKIMAAFRVAFEKGGATPELAEETESRLSAWVGQYIPGPEMARPCAVENHQG